MREITKLIVSSILIVLGVMLFVGGVLGGLYVGIWYMLIGGIVQVVEGVKMDPVSSMDIALGIARVIFAAAAGWVTFFIGLVSASAVWGLGGFSASVSLGKKKRKW